MQEDAQGVRRRDLLALVGAMAGSAAMYQAMTSLGFAAESPYPGPIKLEGDPRGASVLVLGAGLAGMTAALELRKAGYKVQILEFNSRAGGRNWTLRGGDRVTELGGFTQICEFEQGLYINPGPWRIPYHHRALLDYCRRLGVALEPFIQLNHNAFLHASRAFGGVPQRIRAVRADFHGQIAELLAKATRQGKLDEVVTTEDQEILLQALRSWGALDHNYRYNANLISAEVRGYATDPGGGLAAAPEPSEPVALPDILKSRLWRYLHNFASYNFQTTMFQPVGGMDMIGKAFAKEVGDVIRYNAKVTEIRQDDRGVTVTFADTGHPENPQTATADWCVCTIPLSILSQLPIDVGADIKSAIDSVPYAAAVKIGLQFKRRFWEEDDAIYGGISYTDLPICSTAPTRSSSPRCRPRSGSPARSNSVPPFTRNTRPSSRTASRSPGIGCRSRSAAAATGRRRRARGTTAISAGSTGVSCSPASTHPRCQRGRRGRSCPRSMPSRGCTSAW
jgi:monoamine oxidase